MKKKMEGIYLMHVREFISTNKNIYKIGRSHDIDNRVRQYPKGSRIEWKIEIIV